MKNIHFNSILTYSNTQISKFLYCSNFSSNFKVVLKKMQWLSNSFLLKNSNHNFHTKIDFIYE